MLYRIQKRILKKKLITICIKMALNVMLLYLKFDEDFGCL